MEWYWIMIIIIGAVVAAATLFFAMLIMRISSLASREEESRDWDRLKGELHGEQNASSAEPDQGSHYI
jgi:hypothetical protein